MDKNILKSFAIEARRELIDKIKVKARQYGIEKDSIKNSNIISSDSIVINGTPLSKEEKLQREKLIKKIKDINENGGDGYISVIEEVAYTWFNRFTALRFMEVNNYIPTRVRPLSSTTPGSVEPELIKEASNVDLKVDKQKIYEMKLNNNIGALFKYMIIAQCNSLNTILPFMFEKIGHYTELLLPDGLLNEGSFIRRLTDTNIIPENNWEDVEIIGWLYQYYNSEEKDRVIKAKKKYTKDEIPFATQLFTPDWIVRYMVQNSLGRYWIESHPEHNELKKEWEFYLENPNPEPDFEEKLAPYINKELKVEDIKCFDPACGSGHILVYMFDVLYQIYEKCGYMNREIPRLIIENNLYGLDIDDRAYQLACFAVIMKGMKYNNRLLRSIEREGIEINIASIQETNNINDIDIEYIAGESSGENYKKVKEFIEQFKDAKIYGSLIKVGEFDKEFLEKRCDYILNNPVEHIEYQGSKNKQVDELLEKLIKQAYIMKNIYDILVTNPPYMGSRYMEIKLTKYLKKNYNSNTDLFSAFMEYSFKKVNKRGHLGFLTPYVWMFLDAYNDLRKFIVKNKDLSSLIQLEYNAFPEACVQVCTFTLRNNYLNLDGEYIRLSDFTGSENQPIKTLEAIKNPNVYYRYSKNNQFYENIPFCNIGYWINNGLIDIFKNEKRLIDFIDATGSQNITSDNKKYLRYLWEVSSMDINNKWALYTKGGSYRKWYGNLEFVVNWSSEAINYYKSHKTANLLNEKYWFRKGLSYNGISNRGFSIRFSDKCIYDKKGPTFHIIDDNYFSYIFGLLNTKVIDYIMNLYNPTMSYQKKDVDNLPIIINDDKEINKKIEKAVYENFLISKNDWDNYETSIDFKSQIICREKNSNFIKEVLEYWIEKSRSEIDSFRKNEELINKIFLEIYKMDNEIDFKVEEKDITLKCNASYRYRKNKKNENEVDDDEFNDETLDNNELNSSVDILEVKLRTDTIKEFISYAVGCMFGRYSLDQEGLVYAGGEFDQSKYKMFKADEDNIIPVLSDSYFEDDIVAKFVEFVRVTFGEESLSENLDFIAEILGKKNNETAKDTIRRYFINDFFKDHVQTYKKRPIYWLFTSGKQKAFNCLVYMHRYDKTTLSRIRTDYLHELQDRLDTERKSLTHVIDGDYSNKEKNDAKKKLTTIDKQIDELKKYDEVLHHMADMQIEIDLDNGVVENYKEFKELVSKI